MAFFVMKKFRSNLVLFNHESDVIDSLDFKSQTIDIELSHEPTGKFWKSFDGSINSCHKENQEIPPFANGVPSDELIIIAETEQIAEDVLSTIKGGILLGYPDVNQYPLNLDFNNVDEVSKKKSSSNVFTDGHKQIGNIDFGCKVLQKAFGNSELQYAIEKWKQSMKINSMTPNSAHPKYGQMFKHYEVDKSYHTSGAFAIIAAFSAVEELGLEVRSSSKKKRFLDNEKGKWNPEVLEDIEVRLSEVGIEKDDTFDWVFRGRKTEIENDLKPYFGHNSKWTKLNQDVRDKTLSFPEAIHNLSYLRNFIASHKFKKITRYISPYDIFNAQTLARNLILRKLGLWQVYT